MLPCVLPLSLRRTNLDTSELKTVKLFHLSGRPRSWTLYDFLNFAYLSLSHSKNLVYSTLWQTSYVEDVSFDISWALSILRSLMLL
jgi:hypothetical protein